MPRRKQIAMAGTDLVRLRRVLGLTQDEISSELNKILDRRYDKARVSRWEKGAEAIPATVAATVRQIAALRRPAEADVNEDAAMDCIIAAVVNQKGGVGKTTVSVNLAYLLARDGARVLLIDADIQANATQNLGIDPLEAEKKGHSLARAFDKDTSIAQTITPVRSGLDLVAGGPRLAEIEGRLLTMSNGALFLRKKVFDAIPDYDYIIVDCPPSLTGQVSVSILNMADRVIVPSQTEALSHYGLANLLEHVSWMRESANPGLEILGIVPTLYKAGRSQDELILDKLHDIAERAGIPLFPPIRNAAAWARGPLAARPTLEVEPSVPDAEVLAQIGRALMLAREGRRDAAA